MIKKLIGMTILVAMTAFTVVMGKGFDFPFLASSQTGGSENEIELGVMPTNTMQCCACLPTDPNPWSPIKTSIPPTATKTSIAPTATKTSIPPTPTKTSMPPTATKTALPTTVASKTPVPVTDLFSIQTGAPVFMGNFAHSAEGCNWQGVAGQLFNTNGKPIKSYIVKITGTYNGAPFNKVGVTGMVTGDLYGPGGYEIILGNKAIGSVNLLNIQLFNSKGVAVTNPIPFKTYSSCSKNLIMINFTKK